MAELWTRLEIHYLPEFLNHWVRFGEPRHWQDRDRRRILIDCQGYCYNSVRSALTLWAAVSRPYLVTLGSFAIAS